MAHIIISTVHTRTIDIIYQPQGEITTTEYIECITCKTKWRVVPLSRLRDGKLYDCPLCNISLPKNELWIRSNVGEPECPSCGSNSFSTVQNKTYCHDCGVEFTNDRSENNSRKWWRWGYQQQETGYGTRNALIRNMDWASSRSGEGWAYSFYFSLSPKPRLRGDDDNGNHVCLSRLREGRRPLHSRRSVQRRWPGDARNADGLSL